MEVTFSIDWMSFTERNTGHQRGYQLPVFLEGNLITAAAPRFGYRAAISTDSGVVVMYDGSTPTMGSHYIYSGRAIAELMERGTHQIEIVRWHIERGHRATRIDLAVDVKHAQGFIKDLRLCTENQRFTGSARAAHIVSSPIDGGLTIYIGSRSSEKFVRIYDKAIETGQEGLWTRIEVELKGDRARGVARALFGTPIGDWPGIATGLIRSVCEFDLEAWREALSSTAIPIAPPQPKIRDTEGWVLTQVASAVAKFERQYPDKHLLRRLCDAVEDMLGMP